MLFNFPSRYLFAIGLATVFSRRWSLPPTSGCIPKQPDSEKTRSDRGERPCGPDTRYGTRPRSEGHRRPPTTAQRLPYVTVRRAPKARGFDAGQIPIHSPLLKESRLVSFPPLNNMLKFSGCSRLNSGRIVLRAACRGDAALSARLRRRAPTPLYRATQSRLVSQPDRPVRPHRQTGAAATAAPKPRRLPNFGGRRPDFA